MSDSIKILLVTWYRNYNYGTALQAYSLTRVLEGLRGAAVECRLLPHTPVREKKTAERLKKLVRPSFYRMKLQQWRDRREYRREKPLFDRRVQAFEGFIRENFRFAAAEDVQDFGELARLAEGFDYVVAGSDQIWNPEALDPTYLLRWAPSGKKLSYGSSLSVGRIPEAYRALYREALAEFKCVSIRDGACREELGRVIGRTVVTVADPVILFGREGLEAQLGARESEPFVFCYFLGNDRGHRHLALSLSRRLAVPLRAVIHAGSDYAADHAVESYAEWDVDPRGFVERIRDAVFVVTDSFHATVISILFHVDFVVLEKDRSRPEQNRRILELLEAVGLADRWGAARLGEAIGEAQWQRADEAIGQMRRVSMDYLTEAIQ